MKKSVADYPVGLLISVLIMFLVVYYGSKEIISFLELQSYQEFSSDVSSIIDSMDYLKNSNAAYSFINIRLRVPKNQSIAFDNFTNNIVLKGYYTHNISVAGNFTEYLEYNEKNDYNLILCYYNCSNPLGYDVVIFR